MSTITINNESAFLEYVHSVITGKREPSDIKFENWPNIDFDIKGDRYHSSLPTKLMEGLVCLQNEIDRAYALINYRNATRQKLTNADKERLELVFEIKEGSTGASVNLGDWVNGILSKLDVVFEDMTGTQKTGIIALLILSVSGAYTASEFIQGANKVEIELAKQATTQRIEDNKTQQIEALVGSTNLTVEALRDVVLKEAFTATPKHSRKVIDIVNNGYKEVVKSVPDAEQLSIGDTTYTHEDIKRISEKPTVVRDVSEENNDFSIDSIKKKGTYLIVGATIADDDVSFNIKVDTGFLKNEENNLLYDAFRDNKFVNIDYQANLTGGEVQNARLIRIVMPVEDGKEKKPLP